MRNTTFMKSIFLKIKHWKLFILMFGIPLLLQLTALILTIIDIDSNGNSELTSIIKPLNLFPITMFLYTSFLFGWFWSVGIGLQKFIPQNIGMKIKKFKIFFFIPFIYILLIILFIGTKFYGIYSDFKINEKIIFLIIPLHLFSMFCIFYILYFVSKTIKTVELKRNVTFSDIIGDFFMIWFLPFGIWIIQPRINRIASE
jgi:hypothetical protein